jgi:hypothetical protein
MRTRVSLSKDRRRLRFGSGFSVSFERTLRIPDDGRTYPLPPGFDEFPIRKIDKRDSRFPQEMRNAGGFVIPMFQREALWLYFRGPTRAVQVGLGLANAISGGPWSDDLTADPQNYLVAPDQPWLDGINAGRGFIRQFVAMPLGHGYTVEEQVTGAALHGGVQIRVFDSKPGAIPPWPDVELEGADSVHCAFRGPMGLGAGGRIRQQIDEDRYGLDAWDRTAVSEAFVHIVNTEEWEAITGDRPPRTPISARTYSTYGFPWFELYRERKSKVGLSKVLRHVATVRDCDAAKGLEAQQDDNTVRIPASQVVVLDSSDWPRA